MRLTTVILLGLALLGGVSAADLCTQADPDLVTDTQATAAQGRTICMWAPGKGPNPNGGTTTPQTGNPNPNPQGPDPCIAQCGAKFHLEMDPRTGQPNCVGTGECIGANQTPAQKKKIAAEKKKCMKEGIASDARKKCKAKGYPVFDPQAEEDKALCATEGITAADKKFCQKKGYPLFNKKIAAAKELCLRDDLIKSQIKNCKDKGYPMAGDV
jgi:putative hemolysin